MTDRFTLPASVDNEAAHLAVARGSRLSRRRFLQGSMAATAAAAIGTGMPSAAFAAPKVPPTDARVAIIGAGLAGLNAAYQLKQRGVDSTVYEARDRVGGRTYSVTTSNGLVYDLGGSFINSDHADMLSLAGELGVPLFDRNKEAAKTTLPPTAYYLSGQDIDEATVAADFRPLQKQIKKDAADLFNHYDDVAPEFDTLSAAGYLDRHSGTITKPYVRTLLENAIRTEYGVEPESSSALQLLFLTPSVTGNAVDILGYSDERYTVEGGSQRIALELADQLAGQIDVGRVLSGVSRTGDAYTLNFSSGASVVADWVIVTVPASLLRTISFPSSLPAGFRDYLATIDLGRNEKLFAQFEERVWRTSGEFSQDAWTDLGYSSVWDGTQRQINRPDAALTFYYGGAEVAAMPSTVAGYQAEVAALDAFGPGLVEASKNEFRRTNWTDQLYSKGAYVNFEPDQLTRWADYFWLETGGGNPTQSVVFDRLIFAGEHTSDEWYGFMNGAAQTGRLAATTIIDSLIGA